MKMPLKKFAREYLIEEYWCSDPIDVSVIAPRKDFARCKNPFIFEDDKVKNGKGFVRASWGHNLITGVPCIFLDKDNKCKIHKSKPQECRENFACNRKSKDRKKIVKYWKKHQDFIENLK
jgi:Fe-S-cluster containining protein